MEYRFGMALYIILFLLAWFFHFLYKGFTSPLRRIPGPRFSIFTRLPLKLATISGNQLYHIHDLHQKYGPIVRISPTEVAIASLPDVKEIHRVGSGFLKTEWYEQFTQGREGVFNMRDVKKHSQRRKLFARPFSKTKELTTIGVCDILKWTTFLASDVSANLMFGESFEMLQRGESSKDQASYPSFRFLDTSSHTYLSNPFGKFGATASLPGIFFSGLVHASEKDGASFNDMDVAIEAGNLIVAGSDTTAVTLTYLIWAILSRPKLHTQLGNELATLRENWDEGNLESLSLLNATITETLRLYGAAPGALPRSVPEGGVTFSGYYIPGGVTVSTQSWTIHRDPVLYPNPEKFDPSRWLPGDNQASEQARLAMSPFGSGSRTCLGIHLSWMELRLATAEFFLQCGNVKLAPSVTEESMKPKHFFLIAPSAHKCEITLAT
ncbi:hypothetical protein N7513_004334 [Penicillium frequentans]|nr:hypothetical protein N7513_004334 [Penicillium glabrum]